MEINEAIRIVQPELTEKRYHHTLRVAETAVKLADRFNVSIEKAELAAILHDFAKFFPLDKMERIIRNSDALPDDLLAYHHELWHAPAGAAVLHTEFGMKDHEVLHAIRYHTTGRKSMGKLELVVFLADYIEPGRSFPGLDDVRTAAKTDLIQACWMALKNTIEFLMKKESQIYPDTFHAYNDLTTQLQGGAK